MRFAITVGVDAFSVIRPLLFDGQGIARDDIGVDGEIDYPSFRVVCDRKEDALALAGIIHERTGLIAGIYSY